MDRPLDPFTLRHVARMAAARAVLTEEAMDAEVAGKPMMHTLEGYRVALIELEADLETLAGLQDDKGTA